MGTAGWELDSRSTPALSRSLELHIIYGSWLQPGFQTCCYLIHSQTTGIVGQVQGVLAWVGGSGYRLIWTTVLGGGCFTSSVKIPTKYIHTV